MANSTRPLPSVTTMPSWALSMTLLSIGLPESRAETRSTPAAAVLVTAAFGVLVAVRLTRWRNGLDGRGIV